jgi:hypothetical protein
MAGRARGGPRLRDRGCGRAAEAAISVDLHSPWSHTATSLSSILIRLLIRPFDS